MRMSSSWYREGVSRVGSTSPPFRKKHEGQSALLAPALSRESYLRIISMPDYFLGGDALNSFHINPGRTNLYFQGKCSRTKYKMHSSEALDVADLLQECRPIHMPVSSLREELAPLALFGPTPRKLVLEGSAAPPTRLCSDFLCCRKRTTLETGTSSLRKQLCFILGSSGPIPLPASLPRLK